MLKSCRSIQLFENCSTIRHFIHDFLAHSWSTGEVEDLYILEDSCEIRESCVFGKQRVINQMGTSSSAPGAVPANSFPSAAPIETFFISQSCHLHDTVSNRLGPIALGVFNSLSCVAKLLGLNKQRTHVQQRATDLTKDCYACTMPRSQKQLLFCEMQKEMTEIYMVEMRNLENKNFESRKSELLE